VAQPSHGADPVQAGHVEVDHDCIRIELIHSLERLEPVVGHSDDREPWLLLDEHAERLQVTRVVVRKHHGDGLTQLVLHVDGKLTHI